MFFVVFLRRAAHIKMPEAHLHMHIMREEMCVRGTLNFIFKFLFLLPNIPSKFFSSFTMNMRGSELRNKQINIPQSLNCHVADELGLTMLLEPFLIRSLHDKSGLVTFINHVWHHILAFWDLSLGSSFQSFFLHSDSTGMFLVERLSLVSLVGWGYPILQFVRVGTAIGIYPTEDIDHPLFEAYLYSCIPSPPRETI